MSATPVHSPTRRCFLQNTALATLGISGSLHAQAQTRAADTAKDAFAFPLLGDLHFDKLEHHSMEWLQKHKAGDLSQIKNYTRITAEVTPQLLATVKRTITTLNQTSETQVPFTLQVGDLVEGLCGTEELSRVQNQEAIDWIASAQLGAPFLFTKGNHDVTGDGSKAAFADVFHPFLTEQTRRLTAQAEAIKSAHYTVERNGALFCFFDAYDDESLAWLEAMLARRTARHCFVIIHPPVVPYGARSTWYLFAREKQKAQREKLLDLLGHHNAFVLGGHIHRFNSLVRATPGGGRFLQLAVSSIVSAPDVVPKTVLTGLKDYTGEQIQVEPKYSPETETERRAVYDVERPFVKAFNYADASGYAVIKVNGENVSAEMYAGISREPWHIVEMSKSLAEA